MADDQQFARPLPVNDIDMAFGGDIEKLMPQYQNLPDEFQRSWHHDSHKWCGPVNRWFSEGLDTSKFTPKEGIDANTAWRHLRALMGSWAPKHEHKIACVAWLMSQWFEEPAHVNDQQLGEGFAFFRWHSFKYPCHAPGHPHDAGEQRVCRGEFRLFSQNIPALKEVQP